jgi:hypothetical protein
MRGTESPREASSGHVVGLRSCCGRGLMCRAAWMAGCLAGADEWASLNAREYWDDRFGEEATARCERAWVVANGTDKCDCVTPPRGSHGG